MIMILLGAAGMILTLTIVAVYSAFVLAHRTDVIIASMKDEGGTGDRRAAGPA
jgi:hypothetical protein